MNQKRPPPRRSAARGAGRKNNETRIGQNEQERNMKHNILRGATPATVMWHPVPYCDGDRELIEFVQGAIDWTRAWWPAELPHEAEAIYQWWPMDSDAIARLCNYVLGAKGMIEREPIEGAFTHDVWLAYVKLMTEADQRLTALLGEVLRVEDEIRTQSKGSAE